MNPFEPDQIGTIRIGPDRRLQDAFRCRSIADHKLRPIWSYIQQDNPKYLE
jgi:hypothetical protein